MGRDMNSLYPFISGSVMMGAWVAGLFFFRFWSKTRDRLFKYFGIAFWLLAVERIVLVFFVSATHEDHSLVYLIRLAAFVLILSAIVDKNRTDHRTP